jgi:hypothetical protein
MQNEKQILTTEYALAAALEFAADADTANGAAAILQAALEAVPSAGLKTREFRQLCHQVLGDNIVFHSKQYGPQSGSMREAFHLGENWVLKINRSSARANFNEQEFEGFQQMTARGLESHFAACAIAQYGHISLLVMEATEHVDVDRQECSTCDGHGEHRCNCKHCTEYGDCADCNATGYNVIGETESGEIINLDTEFGILQKQTGDWPQGGISKLTGTFKWYDYQPW